MKYVFIGNGTDDIKSYYIDFNRFDYSHLFISIYLFPTSLTQKKYLPILNS